MDPPPPLAAAATIGHHGGVDPSALHALVEQGFNDGDVEALVRLYEPGARMVRDDGTAAVGTDEIRALLTGLLEPGGRIGVVTLRRRGR